jgi:ribonuclease R
MSRPARNKTLKQIILEYVSGTKFRPSSEREIFKKLNLQQKFYSLFRNILKEFVSNGVLLFTDKKYIFKRWDEKFVEGTISVHLKGFGFVNSKDNVELKQDVFIPKQSIAGAVDGDFVRVSYKNSEKGWEGKVASILKRGHTHIGATIYRLSSGNKALAFSHILGLSKLIEVDSIEKIEEGSRVLIEVSRWGDEKEAPVGSIVSVIGHISDPSCDVKAAIAEFSLHENFSSEVLAEARDYGSVVSKAELKKREDFSKMRTITIDPDTAKDFDDALSIRKNEDGGYSLDVHIADVAHYVKPGSLLDAEAMERSNSTYFPGFCLPMLPHELSSKLCSLQPKVVRLTISVCMRFDSLGNLLDYRICRSFIKSFERLTYEQAKEILDGKICSPYLEDLEVMVELALLLKNKRFARGSIDFSMPDLVVLVDDEGKPLGMKRVEYDITHQLVEEFMLKANEVVAKHLIDKKSCVLFRVHEHPSEDDFENFYNLARSLDFSLKKEPAQQDVQLLFQQAKETPHMQQLAVCFIRSLKLAYYSKENVGHFGLALDYYCHFTSPIRRYTDLVIQRLLFNEEGEGFDLKAIAEKCSSQERVSFRAEIAVKGLKKLRLLDEWIKNDPSGVYDVIITRVKPFGVFFDFGLLMLEGFLHISKLESDYFNYCPVKERLVGRSSAKIYSVGSSLKVRPVKVDFVLLESYWEISESNKKRKGCIRR